MSDRVSRLAEIRRKRKAQEISTHSEGRVEAEGHAQTELPVQADEATNDSIEDTREEEVSHKSEENDTEKVEHSNIQPGEESTEKPGIEPIEGPSKEPITLPTRQSGESSEEIPKVTAEPDVVVAEEISEKPRNSSTLETATGSENLSYNSDLKRDLLPYLKKARLDTERALNQILQQKFKEAALAKTEEEV